MAETDIQIDCPACGTAIAPSMLSCPACRRLVHAETLKRLASEAQAAEEAQDLGAALRAWREVLALLPLSARQCETVAAKVTELSRLVDEGVGKAVDGGPDRPASGATPRGWLSMAGLTSLVVLLLSKGKLLLLGLTKAGTLFSMLASLGVYWAAWGYKFALGLVISIYIHEMGHVAALVRYGIKATAPMFIPGLGAVVRLKQYPVSPREDARVGLAGPIWGLAAAIGAYGVYMASGWQSWAAIARVGAWINLFNLLPISQLDGGRGFRALSQSQRWLLVIVIAAAWYLSGEGLLILLLIVAAVRVLGGRAPAAPDRIALLQFVVLIASLTAICMITAGQPGI